MTTPKQDLFNRIYNEVITETKNANERKDQICKLLQSNVDVTFASGYVIIMPRDNSMICSNFSEMYDFYMYQSQLIWKEGLYDPNEYKKLTILDRFKPFIYESEALIFTVGKVDKDSRSRTAQYFGRASAISVYLFYFRILYPLYGLLPKTYKTALKTIENNIDEFSDSVNGMFGEEWKSWGIISELFDLEPHTRTALNNIRRRVAYYLLTSEADIWEALPKQKAGLVMLEPMKQNHKAPSATIIKVLDNIDKKQKNITFTAVVETESIEPKAVENQDAEVKKTEPARRPDRSSSKKRAASIEKPEIVKEEPRSKKEKIESIEFKMEEGDQAPASTSSLSSLQQKVLRAKGKSALDSISVEARLAMGDVKLTEKQINEYKKDPEAARLKLPAKVISALDLIAMDELRREEKSHSVTSMLNVIDLFTVPLPAKGKPLTLPILIQLTLIHPEYKVVNVLAKLWYVDAYGGDKVKQPPYSDNDIEFFRYQLDHNDDILTEVEPVRACFFHSIEEIEPKFTPLDQFRGKFFSSLNFTARAFGSNERGCDAWSLAGHKPAVSLLTYCSLSGPGFNNHQMLCTKLTYPNTLLEEVYPRDMLAMLCRDECNEYSCVMPHAGQDSTPLPCNHNYVHQVEADEIDPDKVGWNERSAIAARQVLTKKWLNTPWGRRIWFYRLRQYEATTLLEHPMWYDKVFNLLSKLNSTHWKIVRPIEYRYWPTFDDTYIETLEDLQKFGDVNQGYYQFFEQYGILGISKYSQIKYNPEKLTDPDAQPQYGDDVTFLTSWILKSNKLNMFKKRTDPDYMCSMYIPIKRSLLQAAGLIEQEPVEEWMPKQYTRWNSAEAKHDSYIKYEESNRFVKTWLIKKPPLMVPAGTPATEAVNYRKPNNPYGRWRVLHKEMKELEAKYDAALKATDCPEAHPDFIQVEHELYKVQVKIAQFECAEESLFKGKYTTLNNARQMVIEGMKLKYKHKLSLADMDDREVETLAQRRREEELERLNRAKLQIGPLVDWNQMRRK
jgi:hypothetical protein